MNYLLALLIYVFFSIIPILMLILYPFNFFKTCLSKCKLNPLVLSGFMEKFHSCYKNGNNGKDMKSLSALYFVLRHLIFLHHFLFILVLSGLPVHDYGCPHRLSQALQGKLYEYL